MSRSFSSGSRTVRRRWSASGWPAPNVRGTRPRRRRPSATAAARSGDPKSTRMKFVTDGPTDQPIARSASVRRVRSRATRARLAVEDRRVEQRLGDDGDRDGRDGAGRPVRVEPGDHLGPGDREPDPQPGEGVGLARGPDDDEVRVVVAEPEQRGPDELRVGLVEDDDRWLATGRGGVVGQCREERRDRAVRLGEGGRVVRAAQPDDGGAGVGDGRPDGRRVEREAGRFGRGAGPRRPSPPRCSVTTRYIA